MSAKLTYTSILSFLVFISFTAISPSKSCTAPPRDTFPGLDQPFGISGDEQHVGNKPENDFGKPHDEMRMNGWKRYQSFPDAEARDQIPLAGEVSRSIEGGVPPFARAIPEDFHLKRTSLPLQCNADAARSETSFTTSPPWVIETVDVPNNFRGFYRRAISVDVDVDVDVDDHPHIAYGDDYLYYAYHDSDGWHYEVVDVSSEEGCYASLGIDSTGKMHIGYYDSGNDDLKYVTNRSGSWVAETIDSEGDVGRYTSLAIDSKDKVHISYFDERKGNLKYATNKSGSWVAETVDGAADFSGYTSLAIDPKDKVHISYFSYLWLIGDLKYATNKSGSWVTETLQYLGYKPREFDGSASLAIDSTDKVHISFYDARNNDLKYVTNKSGSWVIETVDSEEHVGVDNSLAIDSTDKVHIGYFDESNSDLKYATNKSGSWVTETVDSVGYVGGHTSLAIDSTDKVHISYLDASNKDLKYARSSSSPLEIINDLVTLEPIKSTYQTTSDTTGCGDEFLGQFSFDARLTNTNNSPLNGLVAEVTELTNNNLLQNADGGAGGVGARLTVQNEGEYADGLLGPGESVDVHFIICLTDNKPFRFVVDVLGVTEGQTDSSQVTTLQPNSMKPVHAKFRKGSGVTGKGFFGRFRPYPARNRFGH